MLLLPNCPVLTPRSGTLAKTFRLESYCGVAVVQLRYVGVEGGGRGGNNNLIPATYNIINHGQSEH